jgi:hypothetical protein
MNPSCHSKLKSTLFQKIASCLWKTVFQGGWMESILKNGGGVRFGLSRIDEELHRKTSITVLEDNIKNLSLTQEWFEDT